MDKMIDNIMNFINENTTLLIIICVFLIFVLIAYLIDNSIKTKRLAKMQEETVSSVPEAPVQEEPKVEVKTTPVVETVTPVVEEQVAVAPIVEEPAVETPVVEETTIETEEITPEVEEVSTDTEEFKPVEGTSNELVVDPAINDILLKDFTKNETIQEIEEIEDDDLTLKPIENISKIDIPEEIIIPSPEINLDAKEEKKSLYKNDKKLSDIFKKKETSKEDELLNTQSLENELDRILSKLNSDSNTSETKDSTLDETMDFSNMF